MDDYSDIIDKPHHVSSKRPQMSLHDRAAQFSPFAALTGYDECVDEAARLTEAVRYMDDMQIDALNESVQRLGEIGSERPLIEVTYFLKDKKKAGGAYVTMTGHFRVIDFDVMKFTDAEEVPMADIVDIQFL